MAGKFAGLTPAQKARAILSGTPPTITSADQKVFQWAMAWDFSMPIQERWRLTLIIIRSHGLGLPRVVSISTN